MGLVRMVLWVLTLVEIVVLVALVAGPMPTLALRGGPRMGKRGVERPHVVATRLNETEKALFDAQRGGRSPAEYLRWLIRTARTTERR